MKPRWRSPWCVICSSYTRYSTVADGYGDILGRRVRVLRGEPVCLDHKLVDERGRQLTLEDAVAA
jgi:hypothetical protein